MFILPTDIRKDDLGISKIMKISLPNLYDTDVRTLKSTEKSLMEVALLSRPHENGHFGHFPQYRAKG